MAMSTKAVVPVLTLAALFGWQGCGGPSAGSTSAVAPPPTTSLLVTPPPLTDEERRVIDSWLFCIECTRRHIDSVQALATRKPFATVDTLSRDLWHGLTGGRLAGFTTQFLATYQYVVEGALDSAAVPASEAQYVSLAVRNANNLSRSRAAVALGRIGSMRARGALDSALQLVPPDSALGRVIIFARDSLGP